MRDGDEVYYTGLTGPMFLKPCGDREVGASSDCRSSEARFRPSNSLERSCARVCVCGTERAAAA